MCILISSQMNYISSYTVIPFIQAKFHVAKKSIIISYIVLRFISLLLALNQNNSRLF